METDEEKPKIHGMLLRATLPTGKMLHFVPTQHFTPLNSFSEKFKNIPLANENPLLIKAIG